MDYLFTYTFIHNEKEQLTPAVKAIAVVHHMFFKKGIKDVIYNSNPNSYR